MKLFFASMLLVASAALSIHAQDKGVDQQNDRIRDAGSDRTPAVNGAKTNTGTGRGIDFGKGRTPTLAPLPNPYNVTGRREDVLKVTQELMRDRGLVLDTASSKTDAGLLVTQPYTFIKGAVIALSELSRVANLSTDDARGWSRGRYTLIIEAMPVDTVHTKISVTARIEGKTESVTGAEWLSLRSNGTIEQDFLAALIEQITGAPPQRTAQ